MQALTANTCVPDTSEQREKKQVNRANGQRKRRTNRARLNGGLARGRLVAADEDAVRRGKVVHGGALCEKLWVAENLELDAGRVAVAAQHLHSVRGSCCDCGGQ